jgi:hypothetical protein
VDAHVPKRAQVGRLRQAFLLAVLALSSEAALAADELCSQELVAKTATLFKHDPFQAEMHGCRALPSAPGQAIIAVAFRRADSDGDASLGEGAFDIDLALVKGDGTVVRHLRVANAFESDAVRFSGLSIDTGRYDLAPGVRAFGVRINHMTSSRANPGSYQDLSLFIDTGKELRQVAGPLQTKAWQGEWDTDCAGRFETTTLTIDLAPTVSNGYRDLLVSSKEVVEIAKSRAGECEHTTSKAKLSKITLRYDGRHYK